MGNNTENQKIRADEQVNNSVQKKKGMKRMRFFDGLFLTENEFNLEQQYLVENNRLHHRSFHGWGIVSGLEVSVEEGYGTVNISAGEAVACNHINSIDNNVTDEISGAFIVLHSDESISINELQPALLNTGEGNVKLVVMGMEESAIDKNYDIAGDEPIHIIEEPKFSLQTVDEVNWEKDIVLAALEFKKGVISVKNEIEIDGKIRKVRRYAGFYGKIVQTDRLVLSHPNENNTKGPFAEMRGTLLTEGENGIIIESALTEHYGEIKIEGNTGINGELNVHGDCQIHNNLEVTNTTKLNGNTYIGKDDPNCETRIYGNLHIGIEDGNEEKNNLIVNGNCTIKGNLNLLRTSTEIKSSEVVIDDNIITLNKYEPQPAPVEINGGIEVFRGGTEPNAQLIWDEVDDKWKIGLEGSLRNLGYGADWDDLVSGDFADHLHRHNALFAENSVPEASPTLKIDNEGNIGIGLPQKDDKPESVLHLFKSKDPAITIQSKDAINDVAGRIRFREGKELGVDLLYDAHSKENKFVIKMVQKKETEGFTSLVVENNPGRRGYVGIGTPNAKERLHVSKGNLLIEDGNCTIQHGNLEVNGSSEFAGDITIGKQSDPAGVNINGNLKIVTPDRTQRVLDVTGGSFLNGGVNIEGNLNVGPDTLVVLHEGATPVVRMGGDCIINGDLTVLGKNAFVTAQTVEIKDNTLLLNKFDDTNVGWKIAGIEVFRGKESPMPKILWSESDKKWLIGINNVNDTTGLSEIISGENKKWKILTGGGLADSQHTHRDLSNPAWNELAKGGNGDSLHIHSRLYARAASSETDPVLQINEAGNIGINTYGPLAKLDVNGSIRIGGGSIFKTIIAGTVEYAGSRSMFEVIQIDFQHEFKSIPKVLITICTANEKCMVLSTVNVNSNRGCRVAIKSFDDHLLPEMSVNWMAWEDEKPDSYYYYSGNNRGIGWEIL